MTALSKAERDALRQEVARWAAHDWRNKTLSVLDTCDELEQRIAEMEGVVLSAKEMRRRAQGPHMTRAELDGLAELAGKATPGPYRVVHEEPEFMLPYDAVVAADGNRSRCCIYTDDANYIAACSPERILWMRQRIDALEAVASAAAAWRELMLKADREELMPEGEMELLDALAAAVDALAESAAPARGERDE